MKALYVLPVAVAVGVWLSAPRARAAECQSQWRADFGARTTGYLWANSGEPCVLPLYTGFGSIGSVSITSPPRYGTAVSRGNSITYRSRPGFVGRDYFVLSVDGTSSDGTRGVTIGAFTVIVSR